MEMVSSQKLPDLTRINENIPQDRIPEELPTDNAFSKLTAAILAPITIVGSLGRRMRNVINWVKKSGFTKIMQLPTTANMARYGEPNPYICKSAFARDVSIVDIKDVEEMKHGEAKEWLNGNLAEYDKFYERGKDKRRPSKAIAEFIYEGLKKGYEEFLKLDKHNARREAFEDFVKKENKRMEWLNIYAQFSALIDYYHEKYAKEKEKIIAKLKNEGKEDKEIEKILKEKYAYLNHPEQQPYWEEGHKDREGEVVAKFKEKHRKEIEFYHYEQFIAHEALAKDVDYAHSRGVALLGDMPIYVSRFSADTWAYGNKLFMVDKKGNPLKESGAPVDYFSDKGQNWQTIPYNLGEFFKMWMRMRLEKELEFVDELRIDHARWFQDLWLNIPGKEGIYGEWTDGLWLDFLKQLSDLAQRKGKRLFAEDLGGKINNAVQLLEMAGIPGMRVAVFAYDQGNSDDKTASQKRDKYHTVDVAEAFKMMGTHDTRTWKGIWQLMDHKLVQTGKGPLDYKLEEFDQGQRIALMRDIAEKIGREFDFEKLKKAENFPFEVLVGLLDMLLGSKADTVVIPYWDIFGYGEADRLNFPGFPWDWGLLIWEATEDLNLGKEERIALVTKTIFDLMKKHKRDPKQYAQKGEPRIVGVLPNIENHVPQVQETGKNFTVFVQIAGEMPRSVYALTNMPGEQGDNIKERKIKMAFLGQMPSGARLYGIKIKATDPGPWWLNFEVNGRRTGNIAGNTSLFVSSGNKWENRFSMLSDNKDVGLTVNYNQSGKPFEIFVSNYEEFTRREDDRTGEKNVQRTRGGYVHFAMDKNTGQREGITHLNLRQNESGNYEIVINLKDVLGIKGADNEFFMLVDRVDGNVYLRSGKELLEEGLFFKLGPEQIHRFYVHPLINLRRDDGIMWKISTIREGLNGDTISSLKDIDELLTYFRIKLDYLTYGNILHAAHLRNIQPALPEGVLQELFSTSGLTIAKISEKVSQIQITENINAAI